MAESLAILMADWRVESWADKMVVQKAYLLADLMAGKLVDEMA